jgi:hypothetical protein
MVRQIIRSISHKHPDKYQCLGQDNLDELLEPFQHDISFTNFLATVCIIVEYIGYDWNCLYAGIISATYSNYTQYGLKHSPRLLRIR